ncbi:MULTISPECIES: hypothetical protein [Bacillus subtilis group]|uniref:hypothetical protein n=1 Tax=Bacillus TaxID=1386 RepID=UPI000E4F636F|nr:MULTISPECIES: hypothetical protein [Bacillus subtilis group]MBT3123307.1 hypothetical protein [Bacillus inaquosorum]MCB5337224.1 hypothetical protein [Bacillus amyloliquefaciens]MCF7615545.1 hypothetical protein [Bacillus subtilis]QWK35206.1 hypothetical protein KM843_20075 [Bacillus velezensis]RHL12451.1 hypothetical protein DW032_19625 [Bacillus licheniformis]
MDLILALYILMAITGLIPIIASIATFTDVFDTIGDIFISIADKSTLAIEKAFDRRSLRKRSRISRKEFRDYKKMVRSILKLEHKVEKISNKVEQRYAVVNIGDLKAKIGLVKNILSPHGKRNGKNLTIRDFPESYWKVKNVLIRYEVTLFQIAGRYFPLFDHEMTLDHEVHIGRLSKEFGDIIDELRVDLCNEIKPFRDYRSAIVDTDIQGAKDTLSFEKDYLKRSKGDYSSIDLNKSKPADTKKQSTNEHLGTASLLAAGVLSGGLDYGSGDNVSDQVKPESSSCSGGYTHSHSHSHSDYSTGHDTGGVDSSGFDSGSF